MHYFFKINIETVSKMSIIHIRALNSAIFYRIIFEFLENNSNGYF